MIKYILKCDKNHEFESWFSNSAEFEKLCKKKLLECIYCSSRSITKSIMSPMINGSKKSNMDLNNLNENFKKERDSLKQLRKYIENNFEFVGKDFSRKVREIYYDKNTKKTIYGTTTEEERAELQEEGIELLSIPWVNKDN